jgi:1-acyl-sn-glycerol-3-phosphate acyltransferase
VSDAASISAWIVVQVARELHLDPAAIDPAKPVGVLGLDSLAAATLVADLEDHLGRQLPEALVRPDLSIEEISRQVADTVSPAIAAPKASTPNVEAPRNVQSWTSLQRVVLVLARAVARVLTKRDVIGADRVPATGPIILAVNHLHILDALWAFTVLPRPTVFLVASEFRRRPIVGLLLGIGRSIFVTRGEGDRAAIWQGVELLRHGGALGVAPEGRLSRTGGLIQGQPGIARLAADGQAPVVPMVMSGQERLWRHWLRGRRVPIRVRFGPPIPPPAAPATARMLAEYSDRVMRGLAAELPPAYRGVYSD